MSKKLQSNLENGTAIRIRVNYKNIRCFDTYIKGLSIYYGYDYTMVGVETFTTLAELTARVKELTGDLRTLDKPFTLEYYDISDRFDNYYDVIEAVPADEEAPNTYYHVSKRYLELKEGCNPDSADEADYVQVSEIINIDGTKESVIALAKEVPADLWYMYQVAEYSLTEYDEMGNAEYFGSEWLNEWLEEEAPEIYTPLYEAMVVEHTPKNTAVCKDCEILLADEGGVYCTRCNNYYVKEAYTKLDEDNTPVLCSNCNTNPVNEIGVFCNTCGNSNDYSAPTRKPATDGKVYFVTISYSGSNRMFVMSTLYHKLLKEGFNNPNMTLDSDTLNKLSTITIYKLSNVLVQVLEHFVGDYVRELTGKALKATAFHFEANLSSWGTLNVCSACLGEGYQLMIHGNEVCGVCLGTGESVTILSSASTLYNHEQVNTPKLTIMLDNGKTFTMEKEATTTTGTTKISVNIPVSLVIPNTNKFNTMYEILEYLIQPLLLFVGIRITKIIVHKPLNHNHPVNPC